MRPRGRKLPSVYVLVYNSRIIISFDEGRTAGGVRTIKKRKVYRVGPN
jgi:hypothetical protein